MDLLVVVVNYRTAGLAVDCLASLAPEVGPAGARVVVTDNASGDDSVAVLREAVSRRGWGGWASVLPLGRNGGFAYGNNEAIRPALASAGPPRYVLLLNPDTVARPGALKALVDFMDGRPDVGIAGSRLEDPDGTPQLSAFRFPGVLSELEGGLRVGPVTKLLSRWAMAPPVSGVECQTSCVAGASMIVRREVFDAVGLLDEGYFMYFEEIDFCRRALRAGWPCWYVPRSRVVHLVGQSSGVTDLRTPPKRLPAYWFDARRRYFLRHRGRLGKFLADLAWASGFAAHRVRRYVTGGPVYADPPMVLWDFVRYNFLPFPCRGGDARRGERASAEAALAPE